MHINSFGQLVNDEQERKALQSEVKHKVEEIHLLIAERDLWRWRCEQIEAMLEPGPKPEEPYPSVTSYEHQLASIKRKLWIQRESLHAAALEIMTKEKE